MVRYPLQTRFLAAALASVAGFVDALGFLALGGFFVSFMSGNTTRLGVGIAEGSGAAWIAVLLVLGFVAGVVAGSILNHFVKQRYATVAFVALLVMAAAILNAADVPTSVVAGAMVVAMGVENTVFQRDGEVTIGLTYMTGNLVKLGQRITAALLGRNRWDWVPYLLLWLGLMLGATLGALAYRWIGLAALWFAAIALILLAATLVIFGNEDEPARR